LLQPGVGKRAATVAADAVADAVVLFKFLYFSYFFIRWLYLCTLKF